MKQLLRIFSETLKLTWQQLRANKLRTFLSLFGISVGIFSIISIFTAVDALQNNINASISSLGDNVLFINKWAWTFEGPSNYPWWKYFQRQDVKLENFKYVQSKTKMGEYVAFELNPRSSPEITYRDKKTHKEYISAVTADYGHVFQVDIAQGRFFSAMEINNGVNACVIGGDIAEKFFSTIPDPIGFEIKMEGKPLQVIGVIRKKGEDLLGFNFDKAVIVPYYYYARSFPLTPFTYDATVEVRTRPGATLDELRNEMTGIMRASRKLRPKQEADFSINQLSVLANGFDGLFSGLGLVGGVIGAFAILVGGFGIANIMFVSVSERKAIIGIKKALGAKHSDILLEFLLESIFLCLIGGLIGLLIVYILMNFATKSSGMDFSLSAKNIGIGFGISFLLGIVSGIIPAWIAATMDPVEAIRSK